MRKPSRKIIIKFADGRTKVVEVKPEIKPEPEVKPEVKPEETNKVLSEALLAISNNNKDDILQELLLAFSQMGEKPEEEVEEEVEELSYKDLIVMEDLYDELNRLRHKEHEITMIMEQPEPYFPTSIIEELSEYRKSIVKEEQALLKLIGEIEFWELIPF